MTDDEINTAIAAECGWTEIRQDQDWGWLGKPPGQPSKSWPVMHYSDDLNAMHEAERVLKEPDLYAVQLAQVCGRDNFLFHATALQRAKAFLRTLGKWME